MLTVVNASEIKVGDTIQFDGFEYYVTFATLLRGIDIQLSLKKTGLSNRLSNERIVTLKKHTPIQKMN